MSTHAIGPVRLLLGSLVLLLAGAAGAWYLWGRSTGSEVLVIRGGAFEIEPWTGELRTDGSSVMWEHAVADVHMQSAKAESDDEEYVVGDPVMIPGVKRIRIDVKVSNFRTVENAMVVDLEATAVKIALKEGQLAKKGDVWVHPGFVQDGQRKRYEISRIEFLDQNNGVIQRYQNPDLGRRLQFRIRLGATGSK